MTITVISSTPRARGNSELLARKAVEGACSTGSTVEKVRLRDLQIAPCTACDSCQDAQEDGCVIDDDAGALLEKLKASDGIILASPIYFFSLSAQMKILLDRTYALGGGGRWDALAGKKLGAILTYADKDPVDSGVFNAIGTIRDACRFLGFDLKGIVHACCGDEAEILGDDKSLQQAFDLGKALC